MHGQRFALEYASLKPDRHPAMQAREMLRKARFADARDVLAIHMEAEILLAIVDGDWRPQLEALAEIMDFEYFDIR